jgi:putative transposase
VLEKTVRSLPALPPAEKRLVSGLDPGVKAFITRFDAETGAHVQYGSDKLHDLVAKSRELVRKVVSEKKQLARIDKKQLAAARRRLKKLEDRKEKSLERVQGFTSNLHKQTAADLCAVPGRTILLPPLPVSKMVQRVNPETGKPRKLWGKTATRMLNLGHFKFREFLKHKVVMSGCELAVITEEYTSMTCGACGHLNRKLGAKDVFKCTAGECIANGHTEEQERMGDEYFLAQCGFSHGDHLPDCSYVSGRDESAARNIVLLQLKRDT